MLLVSLEHSCFREGYLRQIFSQKWQSFKIPDPYMMYIIIQRTIIDTIFVQHFLIRYVVADVLRFQCWIVSSIHSYPCLFLLIVSSPMTSSDWYSPTLSYRVFYDIVHSRVISTNAIAIFFKFNYHGNIGPRYIYIY